VENACGTLADIYDGRTWKKFMTFEGRPFVAHPYNLGLMNGFSHLILVRTV